MVYISVSNQLACIDQCRKVSYLNLDQMQIEKQLEASYDGQLTTICLNELKHEIAVGDDSGEIKLFSNLDGKLVHLDQTSHSSQITSLTFSPDGTKLISGDQHGKILQWSVQR